MKEPQQSVGTPADTDITPSITEIKAREAFFHPRRTASRLNALAAESQSLREAAEQARCEAAIDRTRRDEAVAKAEELQGRLHEQETSTQELMKLLMKTRSELEKKVNELRMELAGARTDEKQLEEINRQVEQMIQSQQAYRHRISDMKLELAEARREIARLTGRKSAGMPQPISMETDDLADTPATPPAARPKQTRPLHRTDPAPADDRDDDWLMSLPG